LIVIGLAILPAPKHDSDPFVSQCSHDGVMFFAQDVVLLSVIKFGPTTELARLIGKLVKCLQHEFGTCPTSMHPFHLATAFCHRRYTRELLNLHGIFKAIPICAEGR